MPKQVLTVPNPLLKTVTKHVTSFDNALKKQTREMIDVLRADEKGIGLAANQIGYQNRVIALEFPDPEKKNSIPLTIFINPEIVSFSDEKNCLEEGCLSVPKVELEIERPAFVKLKYQDENGRKVKTTPKGLLARILQHEIDHLNGVIFTERARDELFKKNPELKKIKIAFLGSGDFAALILEGLILLGFNLDIYTEQAKPSGRGQKTKPTPVAEVAEKFGKNFTVADEKDINPSFDLLICADFGQKIPGQTLKKAKIAALNIHPSLLPKYRGPSPVQTALLDGAKATGVSIIKMTEKIDQGPIFAQIETEVLPTDDEITLQDRLSTLGLKLLIKILPAIVNDKLEPQKQDESRATLTRKFEKKDGKIDWKKSPAKIERQIRAFHPWPGSFTFINDKRLIVHQAHLENAKLALDIIQIEGKNPISFNDFLRGYRGEKTKLV